MQRQRRTMIRRSTHRPGYDEALVLGAVFPALCVYAVLLWFIHFTLLHRDYSATKALMYEPWLGPLHFAHILTILNAAWALLLVAEWVRLRGSLTPWRSRFSLASAMVLVIALQCWVAGFGIIAERYDNMRIRPDQEMISRFDERRETYEAIVAGLAVDMQTLPASKNRELWDLTWRWGRERQDWYWAERSKLGVDRGIFVSDKGNRVLFLSAVNAIGTHGTWKGYLYSKPLPAPLLEDLDQAASTQDGLEAYRSLGGYWYLYLNQRP